MRIRITQLLGIQHPIVLASMAWITDASLAAAVSEAGGLGTIGPCLAPPIQAPQLFPMGAQPYDPAHSGKPKWREEHRIWPYSSR